MEKYLLVLTAILTVLVGKCLVGNPSKVPYKEGSFVNYHLFRFQDSLYKKELYRYKDSNGLPGAIIAIKKPYRPLWIGAAGKSNIEQKTNMHESTPFRIGSITKVFVAVVTLLLQEKGKLQLEDKLTDYLPELKNSIPHASQITIRMLLNHSSGIRDPKNDDSTYLLYITNFPGQVDSMTIDARLQTYVYGKPLFFIPGTQSRYSNTGYWLVGNIIEQITGRSMQEVLQAMIFQPLQMTNSYYEEKPNENVNHGYFVVGGNLTDVTPWDKADGDGDPSSGIISTAADLFKFSERLFSGKLITKKSLQEMLQNTKLSNCQDGECEYRLDIETWNQGRVKGYGKNGSSIGYEANWIYFPEKKTTVITFANKGGGTNKGFIARLLK
jgi:D-alanyl-D-alanine carboxypeptidase